MSLLIILGRHDDGRLVRTDSWKQRLKKKQSWFDELFHLRRLLMPSRLLTDNALLIHSVPQQTKTNTTDMFITFQFLVNYDVYP